MYEYSIETMEIPGRAIKQAPRAGELDGLLGLINEKSQTGWELVTHTLMSGSGISQTFICTFKREKRNEVCP